MREPPHELARRLADRAEAVCRHYLSNGRRQGNYWTVGDVRNTPGRSMFVRLADSARGSAGRWTDAATGSMAICSTWCARRLGSELSQMPPRKPGPFSASRMKQRVRHLQSGSVFRLQAAPRRQPAGWWACRSRSSEPSWKRISVNVASRLCTEPDRSGFIRAATIALTIMDRRKPGRR